LPFEAILHWNECSCVNEFSAATRDQGRPHLTAITEADSVQEETMKRAALLCAGILCFTGLLYSQDTQDAISKAQAHEMSGTICNSACVTKAENLSTCDTSCTDKSGECVFVDDKGNVKKIENPDMAMPHMGKHVTVQAVKVPTEKEREEEVRLLEISLGR
jgi:hypothetical protein